MLGRIIERSSSAHAGDTGGVAWLNPTLVLPQDGTDGFGESRSVGSAHVRRKRGERILLYRTYPFTYSVNSQASGKIGIQQS